MRLKAKTTARIKQRRWDAQRGCYIYTIEFSTKTPLTERTLKVAEAFGLGIDEEHRFTIYRDFELHLKKGDIVYITGDSGSGKSALLKAIKADLGDEAIDIDEVNWDEDRPLIEQIGNSFQEGLRLLCRVGLNDAFLFLRKPRELSDGQRYRFRLAKLLEAQKPYWICDEFCSTLDRTTARIVAYNIQKQARRVGATLIAATTHTDLEEDLNPSIRIHKGWGEEVSVEYRANRPAQRCSVVEDITIREGNLRDYERLSHLHYRHTGRPGIPIKIYCMERGSELIGVIVYAYPGPTAKGRKEAVGYQPSLKELNTEWAVISRVIIHPKYRSIGLGIRLVKETLPRVGRRHVELIAAMAQYNPFAEKAGMKLIRIQRPHPSVWEAIERLRGLGFDPVLMASERYNTHKLRRLSPEALEAVREALLGVAPYLYRRLIATDRYGAFVRRHQMREWLSETDLEALAKCLRRLNVLSQTKAYLYWCRDWMEGDSGLTTTVRSVSEG